MEFTRNMTITRACSVFVSETPVYTREIATGKMTYEYDMPALSLSVQSESGTEVYVVKQHPHSHSCTCKGHQFHYTKWLKSARETGGRVRCCKHVQAAIDSGLFTQSPIGKPEKVTEEVYWMTANPADLQKVDGDFYVPVAVAGFKLVKVKLVTQKAALFA